jgi:protein involved in polysaccharide export with SLBB domain
MKQAALVVVLAGILGAAAMTAPYETPFTQDSQEKRFYVVGFVKQPGSYRFVGETMTVGQAIEIAGGVTERGATDLFRILRQVNGQRAETLVNSEDSIAPNDTIQVLMK